MGTENPCRPTYPSRPPFAAAAQGVTPFAPTGGAMVGLEPPSFRPTPPAPPLASTPFSSSGPAVRPWVPHFRPVPPGQFNDPSVPPPPSNFPPAGGPFQHFPGQHFSSNAQAPSPHVPPMGQPAIQPSAGQTHPFPPSLQPQPWPQSQTLLFQWGLPLLHFQVRVLLLLCFSYLFLDMHKNRLVQIFKLHLCIPLTLPIKEIMDLSHLQHLCLFNLIKEVMFRSPQWLLR